MADTIHTEAYKELIAALVTARKEAGFTQQSLADRLGKPQSYVAKIERLERRADILEFLAMSKNIGFDPFPHIERAYNILDDGEL